METCARSHLPDESNLSCTSQATPGKRWNNVQFSSANSACKTARAASGSEVLFQVEKPGKLSEGLRELTHDMFPLSNQVLYVKHVPEVNSHRIQISCSPQATQTLKSNCQVREEHAETMTQVVSQPNPIFLYSSGDIKQRRSDVCISKCEQLRDANACAPSWNGAAQGQCGPTSVRARWRMLSESIFGLFVKSTYGDTRHVGNLPG